MSWTTPRTWVAGELVTASIMNTHVRDNLTSLLGPQQVYVDAFLIQPHPSAGCAAFSTTQITSGRPSQMGNSFSGTVDNYGEFKIPLPKKWNAGTITGRTRWTSPNANAGNVVWGLQGSASSDGDDIAQVYGTSQFVVDTFVSVNKEHVSPTFSAITIGNSPAKQDSIYFRVGRIATDGADTKTDAIFLLGVELFLTWDTVTDA